MDNIKYKDSICNHCLHNKVCKYKGKQKEIQNKIMNILKEYDEKDIIGIDLFCKHYYFDISKIYNTYQNENILLSIYLQDMFEGGC